MLLVRVNDFYLTQLYNNGVSPELYISINVSGLHRVPSSGHTWSLCCMLFTHAGGFYLAQLYKNKESAALYNSQQLSQFWGYVGPLLQYICHKVILKKGPWVALKHWYGLTWQNKKALASCVLLVSADYFYLAKLHNLFSHISQYQHFEATLGPFYWMTYWSPHHYA